MICTCIPALALVAAVFVVGLVGIALVAEAFERRYVRRETLRRVAPRKEER